MDTAYKKTLELDKVLARAVQLCACRETKEMMQDLQPCETPEDERYALEQTNAINSLLIKNGSPRFGSVSRCGAWSLMPKRAASSRWGNCWKLPPRCAILQA